MEEGEGTLVITYSIPDVSIIAKQDIDQGSVQFSNWLSPALFTVSSARQFNLMVNFVSY